MRESEMREMAEWINVKVCPVVVELFGGTSTFLTRLRSSISCLSP